MMGTLTQGWTSSSCRWSSPGLPSDAPLGLYYEEAASCRFTNVQSLSKGILPVKIRCDEFAFRHSRESGNLEIGRL